MKFGIKLGFIKKGFDNEPVYNKKYLKTKLTSNKGQINTTFQNDEMSKNVLIGFAYR